MSDLQNTAILGSGVIGMSWAALFLASGRNVSVFDAAQTAERATRSYIDGMASAEGPRAAQD
jgi:carnitine 3-dehydrogenase